MQMAPMSPLPIAGFPIRGVTVAPPPTPRQAVPAHRAGFDWIPGWWTPDVENGLPAHCTPETAR